MNWYKILTAAKRETVTLNNGTELTYLVNPTKNELYNFILQTYHRDARGAFLDGDLIVWDSRYGNHRMVLEAIGYDWKSLYSEYDPEGYEGDALLFSIGPKGELRANPNPRDLQHSFFQNHSIPYQDPREYGDDFDFYNREIPIHN